MKLKKNREYVKFQKVITRKNEENRVNKEVQYLQYLLKFKEENRRK